MSTKRGYDFEGARFDWLRERALERGWVVPEFNLVTGEIMPGTEQAWRKYWAACETYEVVSTEGRAQMGRPVPPHRSGQNGSRHDLATAVAGAAVANAAAADEEEQPEPDLPLFEFIVPSALAAVVAPAHHLKVWADGRVEGFERLAGQTRRMTVINRVPHMIDTIRAPISSLSEDLANLAAALAGEAATPNDPATKAA